MGAHFLYHRGASSVFLDMYFVFPFLYALAAIPAALALNAPFNTNKQFIVDSKGANFTYVGVNWPGAGDVMIPEGLQYASIESIVSKIKSIKMNIVRLTFAIEMIDNIKDNGGDVKLQDAFNRALGTTNGPKVYQQVLKNNPQFSASTTRLQASFGGLQHIARLIETS